MRIRIALLVALMMVPPLYAEAPYVHMNKIVDKLERGETVIGTWMMSMSPFTAMNLASANEFHNAESSVTTPMIDFVLIEMEHQPFDPMRLTTLLMALHSKRDVLEKGNLQPNICPLVRIPPDPAYDLEPYVKQVLDAGAMGVVVPHCRTAAEAERVVRACRYPQPKGDPHPHPAGVRGASPWPCSYLWGLSIDEYVERADVWPLDPQGDILAIIMIEDIEGKENIDEILDVPGIGAVIFGPFDYSFSCGVPGDVEHPEVLAGKRAVADACREKNVPFVAFAKPDNAAQLVEEGYRILLSASDARPSGILTGTIDEVKRLKGIE